MPNLLQVESVTGDEFINPDQVTHVSPMRDSVVMHFVDQSMIVLMHPEWTRLKPILVIPQSSFEASAEAITPSPMVAELLTGETGTMGPDDSGIAWDGLVEDYRDQSDLERLIKLVKRGNFVILDTETTGLGDRAEICSIAIIDDTGATLLDTLVKPVRGIPSDATRIHGITNEQVKDARGWLNVNERVWELLHGRDVIVYNASYDFRLLEQSEQACEPFALSDWQMMTPVCAMNAYAEYKGDWNEYHGNYRWHKLTEAARTAGFKLPEGMKPHGALPDCLMTLAVCRFLAGTDGTL